MTDDLDRELRHRLAGLAAAVPVDAPGSITAVIPRVRAGRTGRRLALGGLVPLVAIVVVGTVAAGLAKLGPFGPGATQGGNGPVTSTATDGPFELTVRSAKARYVTGEPIEIEAALTYRGSSPSIEISHSQGAHGGPLGFGIEEPVIGDLVDGPSWRESCERSPLVAGTPLSGSFAKSGAFSGDNPRADEYQAFFADPVLRLSDGVWHVYAVAEFSLGDCGGEQHALRAEIAIEVVASSEPSEAPSGEPSNSIVPPTVEPSLLPSGPSDTAADGDFVLTLQTDRARYRAGQPITAFATLTYVGPNAQEIAVGPAGNVVDFSVQEVDGPRHADAIHTFECAQHVFRRDAPLAMPWQKSGGFGSNDPNEAFVRQYLSGRDFVLPAGTWSVRAGGAFVLKACGGAPVRLFVEVTIVVEP